MGADNPDDRHDDDDDDNNESDSNDDEATRSHKLRLEQNRISARETRKRKKNFVEELQRTVITLSRENKVLMERNEVLRRELMDLEAKNPGVVVCSCVFVRFMTNAFNYSLSISFPPHAGEYR